ncbi:hypothetical protein [Streptomyces sp. CB03238]|uniref:hypothetical protein n=1 Tax=Streptomyces sp. CB03238 TaxID=1907777 RepID=UPI00117C38AF|nr:hypothetical protein [Streptomyces sp. CB03238]
MANNATLTTTADTPSTTATGCRRTACRHDPLNSVIMNRVPLHPFIGLSSGSSKHTSCSCAASPFLNLWDRTVFPLIESM